MKSELPSPEALRSIAAAIRSALFPRHFGEADLPRALVDLEEQVRRTCEGEATHAVRAFAQSIPRLRQVLTEDAQAAYESDPAATSIDEVLLCYPGFTAITYHRIAHELHLLGVGLVPRIFSAIGHSLTGVDIHPAARIGGRFFVDHGTGVVIGETSVVGERVRLYQGVTLGAKSFALDERGRPIKGMVRHPIVEDDVIVYAGATILGRITIGKGSIIGGNVWLTRSVPAGSRITQAHPEREAFEDGGGI